MIKLKLVKQDTAPHTHSPIGFLGRIRSMMNLVIFTLLNGEWHIIFFTVNY